MQVKQDSRLGTISLVSWAQVPSSSPEASLSPLLLLNPVSFAPVFAGDIETLEPVGRSTARKPSESDSSSSSPFASLNPVKPRGVLPKPQTRSCSLLPGLLQKGSASRQIVERKAYRV